ncbi:MAG: EAL domain-containing response regulator [Nitrosomonas sp.]|nr:EAL domain-containing response regulator [Nitrosomonas sp.]
MIKGNNFRVLLLDDDRFMHEFIGDLLSDLGVKETLVAKDGADGLRVLSNQEGVFDLLICDIEMPGMDGIEFLRNIASQGYTGHIALLSGIDANLLRAAERLANAHGLRMVGVIEKPVKIDALKALFAKIALTNNENIDRPNDAHKKKVFSVDEIKQGMADDQFDVYVQPKVFVQDKRISGVECLARWYHPQFGLVSPDDFISIIEENNLIYDFTLMIFRKSVAQLAEWKQQGLDLKVAVNLSMDNLDRTNLPETFEAILQKTNVSSHQIILELTESKLGKNMALSLDILTRLRLKGFELSIDDFGTGFSTMETLRSLPFTELKIDQTFVRSALTDPSSRAIIESSIQLAKTLNLNLVAEGVETQVEWDLMATLGCGCVQGFFVARPMPRVEFTTWAAHNGGGHR